jgi:type IV pilus assembly protein PilW
VFYGGSSALSTPVQFKQSAATDQAYIVPGPVGFSADPADPTKTDVIVAVQGANCTLSTLDAGGVAVDGNTGFATLTHTPIAGNIGATYNAVNAWLVNLGQPASMGRIAYTVDTTGRVLRTQNQLPTNGPVSPVINDVSNLKAQYGLDTDNDGAIDAWQEATGNVWSAANLPNQPLATLRQIRAVRVAIVARSAQYEKDAVTAGPLTMLDDTVSMTLSADDQHYRYKVLETVVPLRNALWNAP